MDVFTQRSSRVEIGDRFTRYLVIDRSERARYVKVRCDCGTERTVLSWNLLRGNSKSCGCWRVETGHRLAKYRNGDSTHGMTGTAEFRIWCGIKARCEIPSATSYKNYGGRGISLCSEWQAFRNFYKDMGQRPSPDHSIDRIDPNGNYEPSNCRWATRKQQGRNRRDSVVMTYQGLTRTISQWAELYGLKYDTVHNRFKVLRWPPEKVLGLGVLP